jgi:outer membrane cobalamin receptor
VHTRDAIGPQLVIARATTDTLPTFGTSATARVALAKHLALRLSGAGIMGARDLSVPSGSLGENRHAATGSMRLEYRDGDRRVAVDGFLDDRHYVSPPSDVTDTTILLIDRETSARAAVKADDKIGKLQVQGQLSTHYLLRHSRKFTDIGLADQNTFEDLTALRTAGSALVTAPFHKDFRWVASTTIDHESASVHSVDVARTRNSGGDVTVIEAAGDLQYERKKFRADASAGVAIPFGVGADAWPEAKLVGKYRVRPDLELTLTGGRKGRVPSLRERFDSLNGNPALGPEISNYVELRAGEHLDKRVNVEVAPFYRYTNGTIRTSTGTMTAAQLINTGHLDIAGVDAMARVQVDPHVDVAAAYSYITASGSKAEPLDFLPHHRYEGSVYWTANAMFSGYARVRTITQFIDGGVTVPGYTLVEGAATAVLSPKYTAVLRLDDALDSRPLVRAGYHGTGRVISVILQGSWD